MIVRAKGQLPRGEACWLTAVLLFILTEGFMLHLNFAIS